MTPFSSQNTIEAYQSAAEDTTSSAPSSQAAIGGTFDEIDHDDNSTSTSASGSASGTASSTGSSASGSATGDDSGAAGVRVGMGLVAGVVAAGAAFAL